MPHLLRQAKFGPFFGTQFLGAFNDNVFKNALLITIAFQAVSETSSGVLVNLASGLFILPFFIFSPLAGQIADKIDKAVLIRWVKICEIAIMILAAIGFSFNNVGFLIGILFIMGAQSSFFGPVKYSILPQHLHEDEIMAGTGLVEMGTFVAILLGTVLGGVLIKLWPQSVGPVVILLAFLGYLSARYIPSAPAADPNLKICWNPFTEFRELWRIMHQKESIFLSVVGISWFWFLGAVILAQLPTFVKHTLHGDEFLVTTLLAVFTLSVAVGSVICDKLSDHTIELGLVPLGAFGITIFIMDIGARDYSFFWALQTNGLSFFEHWYSLPAIRLYFDFLCLGVFSSLFIVPLYALLQHRSDSATCSRVIAGNNVVNAVFMVISALVVMGFYAAGLTTNGIFVVVALMNIAVVVYIFLLLPEFIMRFAIWILAKSIYRLSYTGRKNIPKENSALLIANHVSFIDWFIITAACQRPVRFVMDAAIYQKRGLHWLFKLAGAIPIAKEKEDPRIKQRAFALVHEALDSGQLVCIFPEGMITRDGSLNQFKRGIENILEKSPVDVVPIGISGMWGSFFSRIAGRAMSQVPKPKRRKIRVVIGGPVKETKTADEYYHEVSRLLVQEES